MLSARKAILQEQCRIRERKLNEDVVYIRDNAGSLLLSGLSWLIAPGTGRQTDVTPVKTGAAPPASSAFNPADMLSTAKALWPAVREIARPILVSWVINRIGQWLFKPKKRPGSR
ncbi:MAG: hypothetical protein LBK22_05235 [Tannerella sp.]|nr:hypothetical protein [Tannerella sp.]